jgi:hypothetical protein
MNLKTKSRYFTLPNISTSVELLGKPLWIAGNIFMDFSKILSTESLVYWHNKKKLKEVWLTIEGHPNYFVSSFGRVKSTMEAKPKILKQQDKEGYRRVNLFGAGKSFKVHRLVAKAFIHNTLNKPQVNHIDCVKHNNCVFNLEWVTNDENYLHAVENNKCIIAQPKYKSILPPMPVVFTYLSDGTLFKTYQSYRKAAKDFNHSSVSDFRAYAINQAELYGIVISNKRLSEMPNQPRDKYKVKSYIKVADKMANRLKRGVIVTHIPTGSEIFYERLKEAQDIYKISIHSLLNKKKNAGIKGDLQFRFAN